MDVVGDLSAVRARSSDWSTACVVASVGDQALIAEATAGLGLDAELSADAMVGRYRRPSVHIHTEQIAVAAFSIDADGDPLRLFVHAAPAGLLAVADDTATLGLVRAAVHGLTDPQEALAQILVALSRQTEERLDDLADAAEDAERQAGGFSSTRQREYMTSLRDRVLAVQHLCDVQHRIVAPDEELGDAMPHSIRTLRQAASGFAYSSTMAARLYASLGDALAQQRAVVNERLTLVNAIFLPLSLGGAFFGMNFEWMTDHIGSAASFFLLGIVVPILFTLSTLLALRRLGR